jgi:hypothetical protein
MRDLFPGYYKPSQKDFDELWQNAIFSFDANILLNIYRYSPATREKLFEIFETAKHRIFIPHQAVKEFQKERLTVISHQLKPYDEIQELLDESFDELEKKLNEYRNRHSFTAFVDMDNISNKIKTANDKVKNKLNASKQTYLDLLSDDTLRDRLTELTEDQVGQPYSEEDLEALYKKAKARFEKKQPPGYEDSGKSIPEAYGDVIIWHQLIRHAKEKQKPLIFVTDDSKEDWWLKHKGKTIGPRPELIEEMLAETGMKFYLYTSAKFIEYAGKFLNIDEKPEILEEAEAVSSQKQIFDTEQMRIQQRQLKRQQQNATLGTQTALALIAESIRESTESKISYPIMKELAEAIHDLRWMRSFSDPSIVSGLNRLSDYIKEGEVRDHNIQQGLPEAETSEDENHESD